jgi:predicted DNA-binding transcriptional regulator AlpA
VGLEDLVGLAEVAALCNVTKGTALRYSKRADFPTPIGRVAAGPIWRSVDVEEWAKTTLPLRIGRPRTRGGSDDS